MTPRSERLEEAGAWSTVPLHSPRSRCYSPTHFGCNCPRRGRGSLACAHWTSALHVLLAKATLRMHTSLPEAHLKSVPHVSASGDCLRRHFCGWRRGPGAQPGRTSSPSGAPFPAGSRLRCGRVAREGGHLGRPSLQHLQPSAVRAVSVCSAILARGRLVLDSWHKRHVVLKGTQIPVPNRFET